SDDRIITDFEDEENPTNEEIEFNTWRQQLYKVDGVGHRIFLVQPKLKYIPKKAKKSTSELQLAEAVALIETLPNWKVIEKKIVTVKEPNKKFIFSSGILDELKYEIANSKRTNGVSAVFLGHDMLTGLQHSSLEAAFGIPVYDRYMIVLRIFRDHARTKEAKLQIALGEIPYLKSRIKGILLHGYDKGGGNMTFSKGGGETYLEARKRILTERESKLKKGIEQLKSHRVLLRQNRVRKQFPVIAIVGYTNAGKTTLIKAMTGDKEIQPKDQLFATLDVTAHAGNLLNNIAVMYIDTVGFISDIPTDLIHSFAATLEDVALADLIIHVCDLSHPDYVAQKATVRSTLENLKIDQKLLDNMIEIDNKVDLMTEEERFSKNSAALSVSLVTGEGVSDLKQLIQDKILHPQSNLMSVQFRVPTGGQEFRWLYKEANVTSTDADESDTQFVYIRTVLTKASLSKFRHRFGNMEDSN
uniref:Hflx-type G domain-containing protein n=1 Tax=Strigamia maritima TaxID=126957 RepID=T1J1K0_STRMM